ncbi:MAG: hypothetical protein M2R45_02958 [Verrucomicrobia subdivision 3 bacterium]|nr:hypothetical protein [Limisphaerales bacterium]MCS1415322.1 hypothetical protein [Limisphaerales bacterium]
MVIKQTDTPCTIIPFGTNGDNFKNTQDRALKGNLRNKKQRNGRTKTMIRRLNVIRAGLISQLDHHIEWLRRASKISDRQPLINPVPALGLSQATRSPLIVDSRTTATVCPSRICITTSARLFQSADT